MSASIWGAGVSAFGSFPTTRLEDLAWSAIGPALAAAGIEPSDVDAVVVGNVFGPSGVGSRIARAAGVARGPVVVVEAACASGTVAVHQAAEAVAAGRYRCVLAVGIEQLSTRFGGPIVPEPTDAEGAASLPLPGLYALQARRYLHVHGHSAESLAAVAVKNRAFGVANRRAHRRTAVTLDEVLTSRPIADPLTVLQCCPVSDGAAAVVVGAPRPGREDVLVVGSAVAGGMAWPTKPDEPWGTACIRRAAHAVTTATGVDASSVDVVEVHDAFTIGEILTVEALGLAEPGQAPNLLADGMFGAAGRWPVNPSGGLLSRGHPLGATGVAQVAEVAWQLTGRADNQLPAPRLGLVETMGGGASGLDGNAAGVILLAAPA